MSIIKPLFTTLFLIGLHLQLYCQEIADYPFDTTKIYVFQLADESELIGKFLEKSDRHIVIRTSSLPRIEIPTDKIKTIEEWDTSNQSNDKIWLPNISRTNYLLAPSAIPLKKGEGYYKNTYVIFNSLNIGITDYLSIGAGTEILSLLYSENNFLSYVTTKLAFKIDEKIHVGGGVLFIRTNHDWASVPYAGITYGTNNHNLTTGLGWGYADGRLFDYPLVLLSGMSRIGKNAAIVSENWLTPTASDISVFSLGIRFLGRKIWVDLSMLRLDSAEIIPYVDFVVKW